VTSTLEQAREAGRRIYPFPGGLRLRHNKKVSCELPLERAPLPERLFVPLLDPRGRQAEPVLRSGARVLKGDVLARFADDRGGFVHAPTSGQVSAIARHPVSHPSGADGPCVVIRPDGLDEWCEREPAPDWERTDPETLRAVIRRAGIVGLGGAAFPTGPKVDEASERDIHTLVLNGAECEPYISCDEMLMREQPGSVVLGARILRRAIGAERVVIAIEDQMGVVETALTEALRQSGASNLDVVKVTTIYPEGGERQLVQALTGLEVPSGGRPTDLGILCQNVATATAVARAVTEGKPLVERIVTVTGNGVRRPRNLVAAVGTPIADLVALAGGYTADAARLVLGGPLMGYPLGTDRNPVTKATNCILVLTRDDIRPRQPEMPCIRCGECARVCPALLLPQQLNLFVRNGVWDEAENYGLRDCIECGCCDFVCPSHIPLVEWFLFGKARLAGERENQRLADHARRRFEARDARLKRQEAERRKRMEDRKKALADDREKQDRVSAAIARARERRKGES